MITMEDEIRELRNEYENGSNWRVKQRAARKLARVGIELQKEENREKINLVRGEKIKTRI